MAERQLIVFEVAEEEFGVGITEVDEIIEYQEPKPLPGTSEFIEGMINLRGEVIAIVNLRKKLELEGTEERNRIIIIDIGDLKVGFIVDTASEVLKLAGEEMKPPPSDKMHGVESGSIKAIGERDDRLIIILDLENLLGTGELEELNPQGEL